MFQAKFGGRCAACEEPINQGQRVAYVGDDLMHAGCVPAGEAFERWPQKLSRLDLAPTEKVCTTCFTVRPCVCDDERKTA